MSNLIITHSLPKTSKDITWYLGKQTKIDFTLNGQHKIEITLNHGWEEEDFIESVMDSFMAIHEVTGENPESVHITRMEEDITILN